MCVSPCTRPCAPRQGPRVPSPRQRLPRGNRHRDTRKEQAEGFGCRSPARVRGARTPRTSSGAHSPQALCPGNFCTPMHTLVGPRQCLRLHLLLRV